MTNFRRKTSTISPRFILFFSLLFGFFITRNVIRAVSVGDGARFELRRTDFIAGIAGSPAEVRRGMGGCFAPRTDEIVM